MDHSELLARYRELWRIEESFRITKHHLEARPSFRLTPERVKADIAIAYMAFACVRHLACRIALPSTTPGMERICRTLGFPLSRAPYWIE